MDKQSVLNEFASPGAAADFFGISEQAISQWPAELTERIENRVIATYVRKGVGIPLGLLPATSGNQQAA